MAIISFRYNFVFIKTTKTAGTSIEIELAKRIEEDAIVTPILPAFAGHRPRNHEEGRYYNHMRAAAIREHLGRDRFDQMFRFCVEREPVDKCISHFHMLRNSSLHNPERQYTLDWDGYCRAGRFPVDLGKYTDNDELLVDRVLRYETLQDDLPKLAEELGLPGFELTARAKSDYREPELVRIDEVTETQRATIAAAFARTRRLTGLYA
ncbi:MAG: Sulfotransferase family [Rhodobacteraceae bacterium HLUCCO07]|nr:MAG: Sulfotransferase family [Rhodobacteraceae bacterium HLUCCO07]